MKMHDLLLDSDYFYLRIRIIKGILIIDFIKIKFVKC